MSSRFRQQRFHSGERTGLSICCLPIQTMAILGFEDFSDLGIKDTFEIPKEVRPRLMDACSI